MPDAVRMTNQEINLKFATLRTEHQRMFNMKLIPTAADICGLRLPDVRKIAKEIIHDDWRQWLTTAEDTYMEHIMLQGIVIATAPMECTERMQRLQGFIPKIDNWAVCDSVATSLKIRPADKEAWWQFAQARLESEQTYEIRFGLVLMLHAFFEEKYLPAIFAHTSRILCNEYYVSMAVAWLLSVCCVKFSGQTARYLQNRTLDKETHNRTIQKCVESFRIPAETKEQLKQLRRK